MSRTFRRRILAICVFLIITAMQLGLLPSTTDNALTREEHQLSIERIGRKVKRDGHKESPLAQNATSRVVMYNRAPKCGSRSMLSVISRLAERNNFTEYTSTDYSHKRPDSSRLPHEICDIAKLQPPVIYNRHLLYVDFRKYGHKQPIYINLIRDPIDRFSSHYNYMKYGDAGDELQNKRSTWPDINVCVARDQVVCKKNLPFYVGRFFCGMDALCNFPSRERVEVAKRVLDEEYLLVGITEEFENTLGLFEKMLPEYFDGAMEIWRRHNKAKRSTASRKYDILTAESRRKLREDNLSDEYELYNFAKEKFHRLLKLYGIAN